MNAYLYLYSDSFISIYIFIFGFLHKYLHIYILSYIFIIFNLNLWSFPYFLNRVSQKTHLAIHFYKLHRISSHLRKWNKCFYDTLIYSLHKMYGHMELQSLAYLILYYKTYRSNSTLSLSLYLLIVIIIIYFIIYFIFFYLHSDFINYSKN